MQKNHSLTIRSVCTDHQYKEGLTHWFSELNSEAAMHSAGWRMLIARRWCALWCRSDVCAAVKWIHTVVPMIRERQANTTFRPAFVLNASGPATTKPKSPRWPWELHRLIWLYDKLYNAASKSLPYAYNLFHIVSRHQQKKIFSKNWQLVQSFAGPWGQWRYWSHGYQIIERHI